MAYIKNLETGVVTNCGNLDVIKICEKDSKFEVMEKLPEEKPKRTTKRTPKKQ